MSLSIYNFKKFLIWLQITHCHLKKLWEIYFLKYFLFYSWPTLSPFFFFILIPLLPFHLSWKLLPLKGNYLAFTATTAMASIFKFLMWKKKKYQGVQKLIFLSSRSFLIYMTQLKSRKQTLQISLYLLISTASP